MNTIAEILARELGKKQEHIENVIVLLDEGNTIPFIARYRKEMHGTMDDTNSLLNCRSPKGYRGFESPLLRRDYRGIAQSG